MTLLGSIGLCLLVSACELAPLDVNGLRCTDDRACGDGFTCFEERCYRDGEVPEEDAGVEDAGFDAGPVDSGTPDAGIPRGVNLLSNPGFEQLTSDGGVSSWRASTGRLLPADGGHGGVRSARLQSTGFQQTMVLIPLNDELGPELGMLFCASLWVRSDADAGVDVTLAIRDRFFDGGVSTSSGTRATIRTNWVQLKEEFATIGQSTLQLRLTTNSRFDGGDGLYVDDGWLSRAETSGCP
ncbi:MAG: hypothetical protein Q8N23_24710 [Archangium sp.]|nr:hypothetical protein [Archangium sp.]MDP3155897.1 hypothetical protein [Archangium sp.]MDP3574409.1 hypothetical protein [Archangium sp.]